MIVKTMIWFTAKEYEEYTHNYAEFNDGEVPTKEEFKQKCIEDFFADRSDYLNPDECYVFEI